jgi:hypothetical protein
MNVITSCIHDINKCINSYLLYYTQVPNLFCQFKVQLTSYLAQRQSITNSTIKTYELTPQIVHYNMMIIVKRNIIRNEEDIMKD